MSNRIILSLVFLLFCSCLFAEQITTTNYKSYINKKIKFSPSIPKDQDYKIANKKFKTKKFLGKVLTISNIELDKKGRLVISLEQKQEDGYLETIKVKTNATEANLQNIIIVRPPVRKKKPAQATEPIYSSEFSGGGNIPYFSFLIVFLPFLLGFFLYLIIISRREELLKQVTTLDRGTPSERKLILTLLRNEYLPQNIFHDLYVPNRQNTYSQIDLVLMSEVGLLILEVKEYSGWIFGRGNQKYWTQVLNYGRAKYRFYNPIIQNDNHIKTLLGKIKTSIPCFSIVVFYGDSELKNIDLIPPKNYIVKEKRILEVINYIVQNNPPVKYDSNVSTILTECVRYGNNPAIQEQHIKNIREMLGRDKIFK